MGPSRFASRNSWQPSKQDHSYRLKMPYERLCESMRWLIDDRRPVRHEIRDSIAKPPAFSKARAICRTRLSLKCGPKLFMPTGRPHLVRWQGTEIPGTPASEPVTV